MASGPTADWANYSDNLPSEIKEYDAKLSVVGQDAILSYDRPDTFVMYPRSNG